MSHAAGRVSLLVKNQSGQPHTPFKTCAMPVKGQVEDVAITCSA